ncbi:MAG: hypothetical protein R3D27_08765 [Hyphomicrobiaceae bacterium]
MIRAPNRGLTLLVASAGLLVLTQTVSAEKPAPRAEGKSSVTRPDSEVVTRHDGKTVVEAPTTRVETDEAGRTKVRVRAPHTAVDVDTERRRVRIRVPYYSGDIRW